jgi:hypothetical protein
MSKDYLPEGITEEKLVEIVKRVSLGSAMKFQFGYHDVDDMMQKAHELAITFLSEGKFKPRGEKPMELQLTNFLRIWIHNRLSNYRRDNSCRYPNNGGANQVKYNLIHPLHIYSQGLSNSDIFARGSGLPEDIEKKEIIDRLMDNFKKGERKLYDKYISGEEELTEKEENKLFKAVKRILNGNVEDYV